MNYEELLDKAMEKIPHKKEGGERFEIPRIQGFMQGNQTIIKNFGEICDKLRRKPKQVLKFLTKALAAPASLEGARATFQSKLPLRLIQGKLDLYVKEYIICKECNRPDTSLIKDGKVFVLKCEACGASYAIV